VFSLEWVLIFLLLGSFVGFMAGLLGIGGGGIMVPALTTIFLAQGVPVETVVHLALGTSMASIVGTSLASMRAHHANGGVLWTVVKGMTPGIIIGTFVATFAVKYISSTYLAIFFAVFMTAVSVQMFLNKKPKPSRALYKNKGLFTVGSGIGAVSALVSIGGGSLTVPFLTWQNVEIRKAIGTSAAIGLPISLAGTLGYVINGWGSYTEQAYTVGFIYLPAVVMISMASFFVAPLGAKMAHQLPIPVLKKVFAVLLVSLGLKMLLSVV